MQHNIHQQLLDARQRVERMNRLEQQLQEKKQQLASLQREMTTLEVKLEMEQEDVNKLTRMSLTNLFHTILRSKEEQLEMEQQQVLQATLELQKNKQLQEMENASIAEISEELSALRHATYEYQQLYAQQEQLFRQSTNNNEAWQSLEQQITDAASLQQEVKEAIQAASKVLSALHNAEDYLKKAQNWGRWDMWGNGGIISSAVKHSHIDDANHSITTAQHYLKQLRSELKDINYVQAIELDIQSMLKGIDIWFDNIITDWIVQDKIVHAKQNVEQLINRINRLLQQLQEQFHTAQRNLEGYKQQQAALIENYRS